METVKAVNSELHKVSANIAEWCKDKGYGLIHEDLEGLRKSINKRVKRLNSWSFRKILHMVNYKCL